MSVLDWAIVAVILVSGLISVWRGFVREAISLGTWVAAFLVALIFADKLAALLPAAVESPLARWGLAAIGLFMATLLVGGLVNFLVSSLVERTGLTGTDRSLGVVFGILRGVLIVGLGVLIIGDTALQSEPWWQSSRLAPHFEPFADWIRQAYPAGLADDLLGQTPE